MEDLAATLLGRKPSPFWYIELPENGNTPRITFDYQQLLRKLDNRTPADPRTPGGFFFSKFRAVELDRLESVLRYGIDVEPKDSVIFADGFDKAWEYGGFPKLMMILDRSRLDASWRDVPASTPPAELADLRRTFPTMVQMPDGQFWLSRLPESNRRLATPYEGAYGYWIPGSPFNALQGILLFARDIDDVLPVVRRAMAACAA